jgi:hypothetical protein
MEFVISALLIVVAFSNIAIFKSLKKLQSQSISVDLAPPVTGVIDCDCGEGLFEGVKQILGPLLEEKSVPAPTPPDESHLAWRNRKEEPQVALPSPHGPPPVPGPLERPYGFSR